MNENNENQIGIEQNGTKVIEVQITGDREAVIVVSHDCGRQNEIQIVKGNIGIWNIERNVFVNSADLISVVREQVSKMNNHPSNIGGDHL